MDRPLWALRYLGDVPADPAEREEWVRRAAAVAAYREESGYADESEAIGPAPERASPELRASWNAAFTALGLPSEPGGRSRQRRRAVGPAGGLRAGDGVGAAVRGW